MDNSASGAGGAGAGASSTAPVKAMGGDTGAGAGGAAGTPAGDKAGTRTDVLMIGTGEYTTGFVGGGESKSDKGAGVVALCMMDLKRRGYVGRLHLCGVNGTKFPGIRAHVDKCIGRAYPGSAFDTAMITYPSDTEADPAAFRAAIAALPKGSAVTVFTPDDTHFSIAMAAVEAGMHVLVTKPAVKTLQRHHELAAAAAKHNVLVMIEVHKRFDPMYADARDRIRGLGDFGYMNAYMSQPKMQLETFKAWAGKASDISYYLNSHHIDFHEWSVAGRARPVSVIGVGAKGVAQRLINRDTEDTIVLTVQWETVSTGSVGVAVYTSSWVAPKSDVHSQQRFFYMGHGGELRIDQAHRGYSVATDGSGYASYNPLFMKYTPNSKGEFAGQLGYGYRSIEAFVQAVASIRAGRATPTQYDHELATIGTTFQTTAILEAGRRSLDAGSVPVRINYDDTDAFLPVSLTPLAG